MSGKQPPDTANGVPICQPSRLAWAWKATAEEAPARPFGPATADRTLRELRASTQAGLPCTYPPSTHRPTPTPSRASNQHSYGSQLRRKCAAPLIDPASQAVDFFFHRFLPHNNFSGRSENLLFDVSSYSHDNAQMYHAIRAVGTLALSKDPQTADDPALLVRGLESYHACLRALGADLAQREHRVNAVPNLWVTLLLGIFELMQDRTGLAYFQHVGPGVLQALESLGPAFFREGCARRFFTAWQWFDLSRCVLLSQPSLLSRYEWAEWSNQIGAIEDQTELDVMDQLLEHLFTYSDFVSGAFNILREIEPHQPAAIPQLEALSSQAWHIRRSLANWGHWIFEDKDQIDPISSHSILARIYFSAISIYISAPFDYFDAWRLYQIQTPALTRDQVSFHVDRVIELVEQCLSFREVAGPALMFPLRIAGARSRFDQMPTRRLRIKTLLERLAQIYAAAEAVSIELEGVWQASG